MHKTPGSSEWNRGFFSFVGINWDKLANISRHCEFPLAIKLPHTDLEQVRGFIRHSREGGNPVPEWSAWIPASAGMTGRRNHNVSVIARSKATRQSSSFLRSQHLLQNVRGRGDGIDANGFKELQLSRFLQTFRLADAEAEDRRAAA